MKKWTPSILIYELVIESEEGIDEHIYFLSKKRAIRFREKHKKELEGLRVLLGDQQLWLW